MRNSTCKAHHYSSDLVSCTFPGPPSLPCLADETWTSQIMLNMDVAFEHSGEVAPMGGGREEDRSLWPIWLRPLLEIEEQDAATFMDTTDFIFADRNKCLIYCDMFQARKSMLRCYGDTMQRCDGIHKSLTTRAACDCLSKVMVSCWSATSIEDVSKPLILQRCRPDQYSWRLYVVLALYVHQS